MLEVYSINVDAAANAALPLNNVSYKKGCNVEPSGTSSIALNRCGVYEVSVDGSAAASTTVQLYKNGIAQAQAQSTGTNPSFTTFVSVEDNNTCCPCTSPVLIQIMNTAETTFNNINVAVRKVR